MKLARSIYYYRSRRAAAAKIIVRDRIVALCDEFPRYGYRRVTAQLKAEGTTINHKTVSRIMCENGLPRPATPRHRSRLPHSYGPPQPTPKTADSSPVALAEAVPATATLLAQNDPSGAFY
jgi:hypothetical protein